MAKPLDHNWAQDEAFAQELVNNLLSIYNTVKSERLGREEIWQESYRVWTVDTTGADKNYNGRADLNVPQLRKEIETMTRRLQKGLFPPDYLKAETGRFDNADLTVVNSQVVKHYLDNVMDFQVYCQPWLKQGVLYGTSPLRTFWHKETNEQLFRERYFVFDKEGVMEPKFRKVQKTINLYNGPAVRAEDLFNTFVYPATASNARDIQIVFWRNKVTLKDLEQKQAQDNCYGLDEIRDQGRHNDYPYQESQQRMAQFGESGQMSAVQNNGFFDILECWLKVDLPDGTTAPCVVEIVNEKFCIKIKRNPYWHQQPPFDWFRFILPPPGEWYGRGLPEASLALQQQLNDTLNQGMDSATLALNNITIINPAFAPNAESFELEPGAQWWADPNGVKQFQFPDLSDIAIKNAGMIRSIITEMSDNSPQLPDPIAGKARSTGQAQLAVNEWQTDLFNFMNQITIEALNPFAQKIHSLLQQYVEDDEIIRITGKYSGTWVNRVVEPQDLIGKYDFRWIGALAIENQSVKTQQLLNFVKVFQTLPPDHNVKLNWENFFIKLLRDGFQIHDIENLIETSSLNASTPPNIEGKIMKQGGIAKVMPSDDDQAHLMLHLKQRDELKHNDIYIRSLFDQHILEHQSQMKAKQMAEQQQAMMQQQMMMLAQAEGEGKSSPQGQQTAGNLSQINEATDQADIMKGLRG